MNILEKRATALYLNFREEIDRLFIPDFLKYMVDVIPIGEGAEIGIMCIARCDTWLYIDCLYICPEYRRQGLGKRAVLDWYKKQNEEIRLHIINNNTVALKFWQSIFELQEIEIGEIDTLFRIKRAKN